MGRAFFPGSAKVLLRERVCASSESDEAGWCSSNRCGNADRLRQVGADRVCAECGSGRGSAGPGGSGPRASSSAGSRGCAGPGCGCPGGSACCAAGRHHQGNRQRQRSSAARRCRHGHAIAYRQKVCDHHGHQRRVPDGCAAQWPLCDQDRTHRLCHGHAGDHGQRLQRERRPAHADGGVQDGPGVAGRSGHHGHAGGYGNNHHRRVPHHGWPARNRCRRGGTGWTRHAGADRCRQPERGHHRRNLRPIEYRRGAAFAGRRLWGFLRRYGRIHRSCRSAGADQRPGRLQRRRSPQPHWRYAAPGL